MPSVQVHSLILSSSVQSLAKRGKALNMQAHSTDAANLALMEADAEQQDEEQEQAATGGRGRGRGGGGRGGRGGRGDGERRD
eukprot:jgi/Psemu1/12560/gm1.12560_g